MNVRFDDGEKLLVLCEEQGRGVVWAFEGVAARPSVHRSDGMNTALRAEPAEAGAWHADGAFVSNGEQVEGRRGGGGGGSRFRGAVLLLQIHHGRAG